MGRPTAVSAAKYTLPVWATKLVRAGKRMRIAMSVRRSSTRADDRSLTIKGVVSPIRSAQVVRVSIDQLKNLVLDVKRC